MILKCVHLLTSVAFAAHALLGCCVHHRHVEAAVCGQAAGTETQPAVRVDDCQTLSGPGCCGNRVQRADGSSINSGLPVHSGVQESGAHGCNCSHGSGNPCEGPGKCGDANCEIAATVSSRVLEIATPTCGAYSGFVTSVASLTHGSVRSMLSATCRDSATAMHTAARGMRCALLQTWLL